MSMTQEHKERLYSLAEELSKLTEGDKQVLRILLFDKKDDCIHADRCKKFCMHCNKFEYGLPYSYR